MGQCKAAWKPLMIERWMTKEILPAAELQAIPCIQSPNDVNEKPQKRKGSYFATTGDRN
jgi:hypothetical protein